MKIDELLPCPFCGGAPALLHDERNGQYTVQCLFRFEDLPEIVRNHRKMGLMHPMRGCLCSTTHYGTEEEAIAAWNRRATHERAHANRD